ncbi:MAG: biotin--[acetyl-CoA-carboxylase] ligase [Planctomycetota bacterium]|nr:biotin--[acetyl-CoA-carboxylase] ligase [Planctomycetota bacterium]
MQFRLVQHDLVDSTSERALTALATGDARHGDVHIARGQSLGRGRRGRRWHSAAGEGLYMSVVLLPPPPPIAPAALTLAAALGLLDGLRALGLERGRLEWPNDLTVDGAKLGGCLVESRGLDPARPHHVLGIGANIAQRSFPAQLLEERPVTSLALQGLSTAVSEATAKVLEALPARLAQAGEGSERLTRDFLAASALLGKLVTVESGAAQSTGVVRELTFARGLGLECPDGALETLALEHISRLEILSG